jgi:hypothetical protein
VLDPPGQSSASRAADSGDLADLGARPAVRPAGRPAGPDAPEPGRILGWGRYPAWAGVLMVLAAALLGWAFTVASHSDPGRALGIFIVAGAVAAGTSVRAGSAYAIIPVPALAYAAAAFTAGLVHDRAVDTTRTAVALSGVQWLASGFFAMTAATALAVLVAIARWLLSRLSRNSSP